VYLLGVSGIEYLVGFLGVEIVLVWNWILEFGTGVELVQLGLKMLDSVLYPTGPIPNTRFLSQDLF